jgi:ribosomal-protein-alanine N-acetyltransferase
MLTLDFSPFPVIQTDRLILREVGYLDAAALLDIRSNPVVMRDRELNTSIDDATKFIDRVKDGLSNAKGISWAITLKDDPKLIGTIGFWRIDDTHMRGEIGYDLQPVHQGKGLMTEAMVAILDYGFQKMNLHSVEANVSPDNEASIRLLERHKFIREGYFRENYYSNGKFQDSAIYSLLTSNK